MQRPSANFSANAAICFALCLAPVLHAQTAPAAAKPAPISCSIRHTPASPGDIAFSHGKYGDAVDLYRKEAEAPGDEGERAHDALVRSLLRNGKAADAESDARAWAAKSPKDVWALASVGEVQFHKGDLDNAGNSMRTAAAENFCNAQVHADYAEYLDFVGFHASAKSQLEIAHKLDPIDDEITGDWIHYQPRAARLAAVTAYLDHTSFLTDKERKSWEREKDILSKPPEFPCRLITPIAATSIPFHAIHNGNATGGQQSNVEWGLAVSLNGKVRRLEIDTGASGILLKHSAAAALGLQIESHSEVGGIGDGGFQASSIAKVKSIKIGGLEFQDCAVEVMDEDPHININNQNVETMEGEDGLIGGDVFQNYLLTLDFPGHTVKLGPLPAIPGKPGTDDASIQTGIEDVNAAPQDRYIDPSMASWTKVFRAGHMMIIPVRLNNGPTHLFIVDTGAGVPLISPVAAREVGHVGKGGPGMLLGISGEEKKTYSTGPLTLDFAGLRQPSDGMTASDISRMVPGVEISGLLGQLTLHQLTISIDYRDQLMKFTYDPNRIAHCVPNVTIDDCY